MVTSIFRLITAALMCAGALALAQAPAPSAATSVAPTTHPFAQQLARVGAFGCAGRANQVAGFLSPQMRDTLLMQLPPSNPDRSLLSATLVVPVPGAQVALANIALAPNQANGCGAVYQSIVYQSRSCAAALAQDYPAVKTQALGETAVLIGGIDRNARVLAMPADKGCILMKQETVE